MTHTQSEVDAFIALSRQLKSGAIDPKSLSREQLAVLGLMAQYVRETLDATPDAWVPWALEHGYVTENLTLTQAGIDKIMEPI